MSDISTTANQSSVSTKPTRISKHKVRTGCRSCKRRRVKCDETKPHCNRCTKAKLQCEGYGIFIDVGTKKHWPSQPLVPITQEVPHPAKTFVFYRGLNGLSQLTEFENASYDFARYRTVADLSTLQCVHFWTNSVMSGCHSDPAILHAILALGAAHRTYIRKHSPESSSITDPFSSVAYTHYGKAIQHLQVRLSTNDVENYRIILIACIVLLSFDLLQERYAPALTHLQHGRSILKMLNSLTGAKGRSDLLYLPSRTQSIDEELVYSFGQIDLQSTNFGGGKPHFSFVDDPMKLDATEYSVPNVFNSIDDAGRYILIIMNDCWQLFGIVPDRKEANWSSPVAVAHQGRLLSNLRRWTQAYHRSGIKYSSANLASDPDARKSVILQIHHALITIKVGACLSFPDELVYDQFLPYYSTIVSLSEELFPNLPTFNFDMAIIQPLYSAAIHCRNPTVRRRAVEILRRSWREGLWDSKLVVIIADEVIGLEENHAGYVYDQQLDFLSDVSLADLIPAQSRIAETWMFFTDEEQTTLRTIHKRQKWTDLQNSETDSSTLYENGIAWEVIEHLVPI